WHHGRAGHPHQRLSPRCYSGWRAALSPGDLPGRRARSGRHRTRRRDLTPATGRPGIRPRPATGGAAMSIFWAYLPVRILIWALRAPGRLLAWAALAALLVAAAPLTLVTALALCGAWLRGWPPARLWRAAAWALPMTAVYLAGRAIQARTWQGLALAP